jgi:hypothetical protein
VPDSREISTSPTDHVLEEHTLSRSTATDDGREFPDRDREIDALEYRLPA